MQSNHVVFAQRLLADAVRLAEDSEPVRLAKTLAQALDVEAAGVLLTGRPAPAAVHYGLDSQHGDELLRTDSPVHACAASGQPVIAGELKLAARWPLFADRARALGYRTVYALPMRYCNTVVGAAAMLASAHHPPLEDSVIELAQALTDLATIALLRSREVHERDVHVGQLQTALSSRIVIEQAKGILAERWGVSVDTAFDLLRRHARSHNQRLAEVCTQIIAGKPLTIDQPGHGVPRPR
jgi:GAF domain-containing protein